MSDPKQAAVLLFAAERDFEAIRRMLDPSFYDEVFGQHVQQAVEKFLKAWLCLLGAQYPFRHDLQELMGLLDAQGILVEDFTALIQYTPYASELRYLDKKIEPLKRPEAVQLVGNLRDRVHGFWEEKTGDPVPLKRGKSIGI